MWAIDLNDLPITTVNPIYTHRKNLVQIKFDPTTQTVNELVTTLFGHDPNHNRKRLLLNLLGHDNDFNLTVEDLTDSFATNEREELTDDDVDSTNQQSEIELKNDELDIDETDSLQIKDVVI